MNQMDTFPSGQRRKKIVKQNNVNISNFGKVGRTRILEDGHYTWTDSTLEGYSESSFAASFGKVLPNSNEGMKSYIEKVLTKRKGKAIGVEFGGLGSRLFRDFTPNFFSRSIAVTLVDHRGSDGIDQREEMDKKINHSLVVGDIFSPDTYNTLNDKLNGTQVDLIIERMARGLEFVPVEPYTISKILQIWYSLLREGGVMFIQTPVVFNHLLEVWAQYIEKNFKGLIEIQYNNRGYNDTNTSCSAFRLRKLPGAPEDLPLLDPLVVKETPKNNR